MNTPFCPIYNEVRYNKRAIFEYLPLQKQWKS